MTKAIFGIANSPEHADRIVNALNRAGFEMDAISILMADREGKIELREDAKGFQKFEQRPTKGTRGTLGTEKHTKAPEGGVTGATAGGIIGGSLGLLAGLGALAIPGLGVFVAAGPIVAALSGSGIGGALGLLIGSLVGMGMPEYEAKKYENKLKSGGVLLCVQATDSQQVDKAKSVLEKEGAKDIATSSEKVGSGRNDRKSY